MCSLQIQYHTVQVTDMVFPHADHYKMTLHFTSLREAGLSLERMFYLA